jgi:predicted  nucleic acid-binding Zn-ribbon protein
LEQSVEKLDKEVGQLTGRIEKLNEQIENKEVRILSTTEEVQRLTAERTASNQEVVALREAIAKLETENIQVSDRLNNEIKKLQVQAEQAILENLKLKVVDHFQIFH